MSAKGQCKPEHAAACAAKLGLSPEECQKLCASGEYSHVNMSIKGMTGTGCENTITTCLQTLPGVVKVGMVSSKDGSAFVLIDPKKVNNEELVKAVSDKGYQAEIIPAVSMTPAEAQTVGAKPACGAAAAAACAKKCSKPCGAATPKTDKADKGGGSK
jgi:copper chaperone CopZ